MTAGSARAATTQNMALSAPARQSAKRVRKGLFLCHGLSYCFAIPSLLCSSLAASGLPSCASFPERRTVLQPRTGRFAAWNGLFRPARRQWRGGGMGFVKSFPGRCESLCLAGQAYKHTYMVRLSALGGRQAICVFCGCFLCVSLSANLLCHVCSSWFFQSSSPAGAQRHQRNSCIHIVCQCKYSMKRHQKV